MNRESISKFYKISVTVLGGFCLLYALISLNINIFSVKFGFLLFFTVLVAPRMNIVLPRSKFILSFSDSMIFLTFLLLGGKEAIIIGAIEAYTNCMYMRYKGLKFSPMAIPFNVGANSASTAITYIILSYLAANNNFSTLTTPKLIAVLGVLGLTQFFAVSSFASVFYSLKTNKNPLTVWKKECFSSSITHFAGAGLAGIVFKLLNYADYFATAISLLIFIVVYFTYRQIITEMTKSIEQAEQAEREKTEAEREKRKEIEKYAEELSISLKKEEETGKALRKSKRAFQHAALHDSLTNLPNRAFFGEILRELIVENKKGTGTNSFVLFLDLARFKTINDSLGHTIGDKVLMVVAKRFARMLRTEDRVARLGGDEFAIILNNLPSIEKAEKVAWKIHQKIAQPFSLSKTKIYTSINIGIAPCDPDYDTPEEILRDADIAMHDAKEKGSGVAVFNKELREKFLERAKLEAELPFAVERGELSMHYQPLICLNDGSLIGFEALLRWNHHKFGFISPAHFIPIAENTGLIIPITNWILGETCRQISEWQKISYSTRKLIVSVNISGRHLANVDLVRDVQTALRNSDLSPSSLKLEITESAAMQTPQQTIQILNQLKELGVQLSIDDFGTGYSSLSYLHHLPFDTLKIDRSFVNAVGANGEDSQILQTIVSLAKNLKMRVIAEGIETESQLSILRNLGCDYGQGYLMSKPLPQAVMENLLYQKENWLPPVKTEETSAPEQDFSKDKTVAVF